MRRDERDGLSPDGTRPRGREEGSVFETLVEWISEINSSKYCSDCFGRTDSLCGEWVSVCGESGSNFEIELGVVVGSFCIEWVALCLFRDRGGLKSSASVNTLLITVTRELF